MVSRLGSLFFWAGAGLLVTVGVGVRWAVRTLLQPDLDAATTAGAVATLLGVFGLAPGIAWLSYRRMHPLPRTSPWQGEVLEPDPASQAELLVSPAAAIGAAVLALGSFVILTVTAVLVVPLAWVAAVPALLLTVLLAGRMLRPTVLVLNRHGLAVRGRRWDDRLAVPWSDIAEVTRDGWDTVLVTPTPNPDGSAAPQIRLCDAGPEGADQLAALLQSYLATHRSAAS